LPVSNKENLTPIILLIDALPKASGVYLKQYDLLIKTAIEIYPAILENSTFAQSLHTAKKSLNTDYQSELISIINALERKITDKIVPRNPAESIPEEPKSPSFRP
jgi:hypothetical protein